LDFPESPITSEKFIMEEKLKDMLKEIYEDRCEIEEEKSLDFSIHLTYQKQKK